MKILFNDIIQYSDAPQELKSPALSDMYITDEPIIINFDKPRPVNCIGLGNYNGNKLLAIFDDETKFEIDYKGSGLYCMNKTIVTSKIVLTTVIYKNDNDWSDWFGGGNAVISVNDGILSVTGYGTAAFKLNNTFNDVNITFKANNSMGFYDLLFNTVSGSYKIGYIGSLMESHSINIKALNGGTFSGFIPITTKFSEFVIRYNNNSELSIGRLAAGLACNIPTAVAKEPSFLSTSEPRVTLSGQVIAGAGGYNYKTLSLDSRYKITKEIMSEIEAGYKYIGMGYPFFIDLADESYKLMFDKLYANERNQRSMTFQSGIHRFLYSRRFEFEERY